MPAAIALEPTVNDPLLTNTPLEYDRVFYPYGFPARIRSNSALTMEAAETSWSTYRQKFDRTPLDVRLLISDDDRPGCTEPPTFRSQGHLLSIVADASNFACLDLSAGFSFGWATVSTAKKGEYFRQCLLDVMIYPLLEIRHLITLHAACVMFNGKGILLAGNSGAGKSSLAYACARRGWTYVSDDASAFVRSSVKPMVIGHPHRFRFREPVGELFPEFRGLTSTLRAYGKPTIQVQTSNLDGLRTADESPIDAVVFLNRPGHTGGSARISPIASEDAWSRLSFSVWAVQLPAYEERLTALERILSVPAFEIRYSGFDSAIDGLQRMVETELR
jgi:hypothetical protein